MTPVVKEAIRVSLPKGSEQSCSVCLGKAQVRIELRPVQREAQTISFFLCPMHGNDLIANMFVMGAGADHWTAHLRGENYGQEEA